MMRKSAFRPSVAPLEHRLLPTAGLYPDAVRNDLQASYATEAVSKSNDVVFLGDSITYYWGTSDRASVGNSTWASDFATLGAANFGIGGDTTQDVLGRIDGGDLAGQPKLVVLMIGVNDLTHGSSPDQTAWGVAEDVAAIHAQSPDSKVLLLGILPTDLAPVNPEIEQVNTLIAGLGNQPGVTFLNPGLQFQQADGSARPDLLMGPVHPDAEGYQVLAGAIDGTILAMLDPVASTPDPTPVASPAASPAQPVAPTSTPDFGLIPIVEVVSTPASPADSPAHPRSSASELINVSSS